ncbi:unnamed protein product [Microthlaspi erraticum]|uniref:Uncharacterized protein n=1 Tax=Microthlaspi erraticum TaxID=1685480 RepID=A0A6D2IAG8_9BRAS|nr:unnamed protein product [Microthlaspi erraticum]
MVNTLNSSSVGSNPRKLFTNALLRLHFGKGNNCPVLGRRALTLRCREEVELTVFSEGEQEPRTSQRHGQESSVKYGPRSVEFQSFDTHRLLATDFPGNLKRISVMRSVEIVSEFSSLHSLMRSKLEICVGKRLDYPQRSTPSAVFSWLIQGKKNGSRLRNNNKTNVFCSK